MTVRAIEMFKTFKLTNPQRGMGEDLVKALQFESNLYNTSDFFRAMVEVAKENGVCAN